MLVFYDPTYSRGFNKCQNWTLIVKFFADSPPAFSKYSKVFLCHNFQHKIPYFLNYVILYSSFGNSKFHITIVDRDTRAGLDVCMCINCICSTYLPTYLPALDILKISVSNWTTVKNFNVFDLTLETSVF